MKKFEKQNRTNYCSINNLQVKICLKSLLRGSDTYLPKKTSSKINAYNKNRAIKLIWNRVIHGFESVCLLRLICQDLNLCLLKRGVQVTTYDFGFMDNSITN
jgi:hypothetical protein